MKNNNKKSISQELSFESHPYNEQIEIHQNMLDITAVPERSVATLFEKITICNIQSFD